MPRRATARSRGLDRRRGGVRTRSRPPPPGGAVFALADGVGWATRPRHNLALYTRAWRRVAHAVGSVGLTAWAKSPTIVAQLRPPRPAISPALRRHGALNPHRPEHLHECAPQRH